MSAFDASVWIGARAVRPTSAQLTKIGEYDPGLYRVGMENLLRHLHYFTMYMAVFTGPNNNTKYSLEQTTRIPFKVVAADVGVESAAGTACTVDLEKNPSGSPDTWATMSTGAVDVKTGAGDYQPLPILNGSEDVAQGDQLRIACVGTGSGAVVGPQATLHCFRL